MFTNKEDESRQPTKAHGQSGEVTGRLGSQHKSRGRHRVALLRRSHPCRA